MSINTGDLAAALARVLVLCFLWYPASPAGAQTLDELMATDPEPEEAPAEDEGELQPETDEGVPQAADDEAFIDDERPPGDPVEVEQDSPDESQPEDVDDGTGLMAGLLLGYGLSLEDGPNAWGFGLGLQGGYDLGLLTVGARFVYYLGDSESETIASVSIGAPTTRTVDVNLWELGIEGGIDIDASEAVVVRPGVGLGLATVSSGSSSEAYPYFAPGVALLYSISPAVYLGLDSRFQVVLSDPEAVNALVFLAGLGMRL